MKLTDCLFHNGVSLSKECLILNDDTYLSFGDAQLVLKQHTKWLNKNIIIQHQVVVAVLAYNSADFFFSVLAATDITAPALLNTRWTPKEMTTALLSGRHHDTFLVLHDHGNHDKATTVSQLLRQAGADATSHQIPSLVSENLRRRPNGTVPFRSQHGHPSRTVKSLTTQDALIVFTSGTTSSAKGVRLSHNAIFYQARVKLKYYNANTRLLANTLPFYHIGGISSILSTWLAGGCLVLNGSSTQRFEPTETLTSIERYAVNALVVVPAMLHSLQQVSVKKSFPSVKLVLIGGQSASESLLVFARTAFPKANLVQTFACTEAASSLTFLDVTVSKPSVPVGDCIGEPSVPVVICCDDDNTMTTTPNCIGRISTRGPHVMNGYWGHKAHNQNEWYISNDLGCFDNQGRLCFCGRTTDTIRTGGETVFSGEVETVLLQHPSIAECAVFGGDDDRFGECVCAAVVFQGSPVGINSLRSFCSNQGLAGFKQPRLLYPLKDLPKNSSGKVLKRLLVLHYKSAKRGLVAPRSKL